MLNIIETKDAPSAIGPYSQAISYNGILFTSGQIPINPQTGEVETTTIEEQTEQVMKNIVALLKASNTSIDKVVKTTCFLRNMEDFASFNGVYSKYFVHKPARSCVAVRELPKNVLVEVEVIAAVE